MINIEKISNYVEEAIQTKTDSPADRDLFLAIIQAEAMDRQTLAIDRHTAAMDRIAKAIDRIARVT